MHKTLLKSFARKITRPSFLEPKTKNFNFEDNQDYTKKLETAYRQREDLTKKLTEPLKLRKETKIRKDLNSDITDYYIWREFDYSVEQKSTGQLTNVVDGKIELKPKELFKTFGEPLRAGNEFYKGNFLYIFQDSFLDTFFLYDFHHEIVTEDFFEYYKKFWQLDEQREFRICHTRYANRYKFKRMLYKMVEDVRNNPDHAYDAIAEKKQGKIEFYDQYAQEYKIEDSPPVFRHARKEFDKVGGTKMNYINDKEFDAEIRPAVDLRTDPNIELVE